MQFQKLVSFSQSFLVIQCLYIMTTREIAFSQVAYLKTSFSQCEKKTVIEVLVGVLTFSGLEELGCAFHC